MHKFDELYSISDTHFGGEKDASSNFQVFDNAKRLAAFIRHISQKNPDHDVALVINGDMIDSLAEPDVHGYVALDERSAIKMMDRLYRDESFSDVWVSLQEFIATDRRHLVLLLGNHDLELALPVVEHSLRNHLTKDSAVAQSRLHFCTHGTGYKCRVGKSLVYCTHGNEFDDWNWVDQHKLSQLANAMSSGRAVDPADWTPNAGTRLVVDVMNSVKRDFPFVDLLKPEKAAVAAVLLALDRELFNKVDLRDALPIFWNRAKGKAMTSRVLSADAVSSPEIEAAEVDLTQILGPNMQALIGSAPDNGDLLGDAIDALDHDEEFPAPSSDSPRVLGLGDIVAGKLGFVEKSEALRKALLDWTAKDTGFDPTTSVGDSQFDEIHNKVGSDIDFVITGHTHLCKSIPMRTGAHYFNTGTWIRLLKFTQASLNDKKRFQSEIWPALLSGKMEDLDTLKISPEKGDKDENLRFDRTNAAHIWVDGDKTFGGLYQVTDMRGNKVKLALEPGTKKVESR